MDAYKILAGKEKEPYLEDIQLNGWDCVQIYLEYDLNKNSDGENWPEGKHDLICFTQPYVMVWCYLNTLDLISNKYYSWGTRIRPEYRKSNINLCEIGLDN